MLSQLTRRFRRNPLFKKTGALVAALLTGVGVVLFIQARFFISWDFRHGLWSPSYLLVHGLNPYGMGAPLQIVRSVWFPMGIGLFFPLGWLDYFQATNLWLLLNAVIIVVLVRLAGGTRQPLPALFALGVGAAFLFPPVLSHLLLGQFSLLVAFLFIVATYLVNERPVLVTGFLVAIALTKPQLSVLALPGLLIGYWRIGGFRTAIVFVGALVASIGWLTIPLWLVDPHWISDFVDILREIPAWLQPSLFRVLQLQFGAIGLAVWLLLALGIFGLNAWLWLNRPPRQAVIWSLALTTLASPYVWSWDFVLLLPLLAYAINRFKTALARLVLLSGYVSSWIAIVWIRLSTDNGDERFWWVAPVIVSIVCIGFLLERFKPPLVQMES